MVTDIGIIVTTVIGSIASLGALLLLDRKWYKREDHKTKVAFERKEQTLRLKKLEKDLGLKDAKSSRSVEPESLGGVKDLIPAILKNMAPEQLQDIIGNVVGETGEPSGVGDQLLQFAEDHPEIAKPIIEGVISKLGKGGSGQTESGGEGGFI